MKDEKLWNIFSSLVERYSDAKNTIQKDTGLTAAELKGLMSLETDAEISCQDLSVRMNLSVSRGSRVIESLFNKGYLKRTVSSKDRRCKKVWLTDSGAQIRKRIDTQIQECEAKFVANIPKNRLQNLKIELKGLLKNF